jgi:2-aminoethylphosphonate-pyruvate transaminase
VLAERVRASLAALGIEPWLPPQVSSAVLRSYRLPTGLSYERVHGALRKHGFVIYAGQARFREQFFRVSTMGEISDRDLERFDAALGELG